MKIECQDCHMKPDGISTYFVQPEKGGRPHNPLTMPSHLQPGSRDPQILANSVTMNLSASQNGDSVKTMVTIYNDQTGHHVPTGRPSRNILLLIKAVTDEGDTLEQIYGEKVPEWGGMGDYGSGNYAGMSGKGFAKILEDSNGISPAPSWRPTHILSDNRIASFASDTSYYYFRAPAKSEKIRINARLIYRRFFKKWMDEKNFVIPDIEMENKSIEIITSPTLINDESSQISNTFHLAQNYPNPFNSNTVINWQLAVGSNAVLTIYNLLGEKITTVVSEDQNPGRYSYRFDGSRVPSGIYYYQLVAGDYMAVKKMILIR